jgi:hypothetical protein
MPHRICKCTNTPYDYAIIKCVLPPGDNPTAVNNKYISQLIINTYGSLMYKLKKKKGKIFTSKFVENGPSSYEKIIYWAAVSQRLRNTALEM